MNILGPARKPLGFWTYITETFERRIQSRIMSLAWSVGSFFLSLLLVAAPLVPVHASTLTYHARVSAIFMSFNPGQTKTLTIKFTNDGSATWIGSVANTALYLYGDSSVFHNATWIKPDFPGIVTPAIVKPGQIGAAVFSVTAPLKPGIYHERFLLSYGPGEWMKGSVLSATFTVVGSASSVVPASPAAIVPAPPASNVWKAELTSKGGSEWQTAPGGLLTIVVAYRNRGTRAWSSEGGDPVWITTPNGETSAFYDNSWVNNVQIARMQEGTVRPGGVGHFIINLRAPTIVGNYKASYELAAGLKPESLTRISNSSVSFSVHVTTVGIDTPRSPASGNASSLTDTMPSESAPAGSRSYQAMLLLSSTKQVSIAGNGRQQLTYGFKNVGTSEWTTLSLQAATVSAAAASVGTLTSVQDASWVNSSEPVRVNAPTLPGQIGFVTFTIKAPPVKGKYVAAFKLMANDHLVEDGIIRIPITVTADGIIQPTPTKVASQGTTASSPGTVITVQPLGGNLAALPDEPIIRVGIYQTVDNQMIVRAVSGGFTVQQHGKVICTFNAGESVIISYDRIHKVYKAVGPRCTSQSTNVYQAVSSDAIAPLEMTDFSHTLSWLPGANDNKFRSKLELRYTPATDAVWVINELPIEWYLKGIGETSNSSPQEYQKALLTAARTYAMYHVQHETKHAAEHFTVDARYDQVYRGYGAESRDPNVVRAVDATRGQIVTYRGKLAITPYYSRSDGRTRAWTEVWGGGPIPWLVSVPVPWDSGKTLWGHGVGMSATGALGAARDGWSYDKILKYFYTDTVLMRAYK